MTTEELELEAAHESKFRMYALDSHGFKVNWEIDAGTTADELNNLIQRQGQLSNWLQAHQFTPDDFGVSARSGGSAPAGASAPATVDANAPACPDCGGPTEFKNGTGKKGAWAGWFCIRTKDAPQASRHTPKWV